MRHISLPILLLAILVVAPRAGAAAADFRADIARDLKDLEGKIVGLAEAIPEDKYSWSPADGVRTISEALMHTAGANFFFPSMFGVEPPEGLDMRGLEKVNDKARVVDLLKTSFEHMQRMVEATASKDLSEAMDMFGQTTTVSGTLHAATSHCHEHLGQMIAYSRSIGVVPPWSAGGQ